MIINTGSRTDIPAYFSEWFYNRIKEGFVLVRNPYYPEQVTKFRLSPEVVDIICFCTKNPEPMFGRISELDVFSQFWFVTITPYGKEIEPGVPEKERVLDAFCRLAERNGKRAVGWRYDPVFLTDRYTLSFHIESFEKMARRLSGYTEQCVVSFIDLYEKTRRNFPGVTEVRRAERETLVKEFAAIGKQYGMKICLCCEDRALERFGADASGCMTQAVLERAAGFPLDVPKGKAAVRKQCDCLLGNDIGVYNTCGHGCIYCYANYDMQTVVANRRLHDVHSPFLIGSYREGDKIKEAKQVSYRDGQLSLF